MSQQQIELHHLNNGMTLLTETLSSVQSAAISISVPAGTSTEPNGKNGTAALLCDFIMRGAGEYDSRQLSTAFDNLGVQYSISPGWAHLTFSAAMVADNLPQTMALMATVLKQPRFDSSQFPMCKTGREQALLSIENEPRQKLMIELRKQCYPAPWNSPLEGTDEHLPNIFQEDVVQHYRNRCVPEGAIIGIAGKINPSEVLSLCQQLFADWEGKAKQQSDEYDPSEMRSHIHHDSTQTHIGIAYPAVPYKDPEYYKAWAAVGILSGGMSSRLFTKVREERGLCYAIGASLSTLKDRARVLSYAGTTSERAQETLDVTLHELQSIHEDLTTSELQRCQARAKSSLIMQEESTMSRSGALVRDWFHLQRTTTLAEIRQKIDALTVNDIREYAEAHPASRHQVLTIGPEPLQVQQQTDISQM